MQDSEPWWALIEPVEDALAAQGGPGPGDDDDDEDESGGGSGGNIDPDEDEGYEDDDEDDDEEPLRCAAPEAGSHVLLRRSIPWYDARVRRSASC
jgi:hypothetical protein